MTYRTASFSHVGHRLVYEAGQMPNATLVRAHSPLELRLRPQRLTGELAAFLDGLTPSRPAVAPGAVTTRKATTPRAR